MKNISILLLAALLCVACSDEKTKPSAQAAPKSETLSLQGDEGLESIMDKVLAGYLSQNLAQDSKTTEDMPKPTLKKGDFPSVDSKRKEAETLLTNAYALLKAHKSDATMLEKIAALSEQWRVLCGSAAPYMEQGALSRLQTDITLSLASFMLGYDNASLAARLEEQYQAAKGSGELNLIVESQIAVRLLALYALISQPAPDSNALHSARESIQDELARFKDFLPKAHYQVYMRAYELLGATLLKQQAPIERILSQLTDYLSQSEGDINEEYYGHTKRLKEAYELAKARDFSSASAQNLIITAQNPLKNSYEEAEMANYLYGIDYLTLALLNDNVEGNLQSALALLKKDFINRQITQHNFDPVYFKNYISSLFVWAWVLANSAQGKERFDELLRVIDSELEQYGDTISKEDMQLYKDALLGLKQVDTSRFLHITLSGAPSPEEGYIKVPLELSPDELSTLKGIMAKEQRPLIYTDGQDSKPKSEPAESKPAAQGADSQNGSAKDVAQGGANTESARVDSVCLSPQEADFMLSLAYQAMKAQGYEGVAPDMMKIRLDEVFGISSLSEQSALRDGAGKAWEREYLIDFDEFLFFYDKGCEIQGLMIDKQLAHLQEKQQICARGVYFDRDNGFMISEILPSQSIEMLADGRVFYRLNKADFALNALVFKNDERAIAELVAQKDKSRLLPIVLAAFEQVGVYFKNRSAQLQPLTAAPHSLCGKNQ